MDVLRIHEGRQRPTTEAIIITGYPSVETVVESKKLGVRDYLRKPFSQEEFLTLGGQRSALREKVPGGDRTPGWPPRTGRLIQKREVMKILNRTVRGP